VLVSNTLSLFLSNTLSFSFKPVLSGHPVPVKQPILVDWKIYNLILFGPGQIVQPRSYHQYCLHTSRCCWWFGFKLFGPIQSAVSCIKVQLPSSMILLLLSTMIRYRLLYFGWFAITHYYYYSPLLR
jgi:hypothetical protein